MFVFFFFFKQKTAYEMRISDWSSDVCSSDLLFERAGCGRGLLDQRGVLLRDLVHRRDCLVDLLDAGALFLRRGADLGHDVGDAFHAGDDLFHGLAGLLDEPGAVADLLDRIADPPLDLLDRKSTRLNSSHQCAPRMPPSA